MKRSYIPFINIALLLLLTGCLEAPIKKSQRYPQLYKEKPLSIMILPPINKSVNIGAKEQFYSSLIRPLTLNGYYVLPPLLTLEVLKEESAYDAEMFLDNSMKQVGVLFGADAVLFTIVHNWEKVVLFNNITVKVEYMLKSTHTDSLLFHRIGTITYSSSMNSGNVFADLVGQMLVTSLQSEINVGRSCNGFSFQDIPNGIYSPNYCVDSTLQSGPKVFAVRVTN